MKERNDAVLKQIVREHPLASYAKYRQLLAAQAIIIDGDEGVRRWMRDIHLGKKEQRVLYAATEDGDVASATLADIATREEQARRRVMAAEQKVEALQRSAADHADLVTAFRDAMSSLPPINVAIPEPDGRPHRVRSLVLFLSDIHTYQLFPRERGGGLGEYDLDTLQRYVLRVTSKVQAITRDLRAGGPIERLVIVFGGDMVDGRDIYRGHALEAGEVAAQLRIGPEMFAKGLMAPLASTFPQVDVFGLPGNHGRIGPKGQLDYVGDSLDMVWMDVLELHCEPMKHVIFHPRKTWFCDFMLHGHYFLAAHGDSFKAFARLPFYGASRYLSDLMTLFHRPIDALLVGHHHSAASFPKGFSNIVMNGSFPGTSMFGSHQLGVGGPPIQKLLLVSDEYPVATQYDLHLATRQEMLTHVPISLDAASPEERL